MAHERIATVKYRRKVFHSPYDRKLTREDFERAQVRATTCEGIASKHRRLSGIFKREQIVPATEKISNLVDPTHLLPEFVQRKGIAFKTTPSTIDNSIGNNLAPSGSQDATSRFEGEHVAYTEASYTRGISEEDAYSVGSSKILSFSPAAHQKHQSPRASLSREDINGGAILEGDSKGLFVSSQSEGSQNLDLYGKGLLSLQSPIRGPIEPPTLLHFPGRSTRPIQHENDSNSDRSQTRGSSSRHPHERHARQPKGDLNERRSTKKSYRTRNRRHLAENELALVSSRPVSNVEISDVEIEGVNVYPFENSQDPISEPDQNPKTIQRSKAVDTKRYSLSRIHGNAKVKNQIPPSTTQGYHVLNYSNLSLPSKRYRDMRLCCSDGFNELESVPTGYIAFAKPPRARSKLSKEISKRMGKLTVVRERNFGVIRNALSVMESPQYETTGQQKTSARARFFVKGGNHYIDDALVDREPDLQPTSREERLDPPLLGIGCLAQKCKSTGKLICQVSYDEGQRAAHEKNSVQASKSGTNAEVGSNEDEEMEDVLEEEDETEDEEDSEDFEDEEDPSHAESTDDGSRSSRAPSSNDGRYLSSQESENDEDESMPARNDEGSVISEAHGEGKDDIGLEIRTPRKRKPSTIIEYVTPAQQRSWGIDEGVLEFEIEAITEGKVKFCDELLFDEEQAEEGGNNITFVDPFFLVVQGSRNLLDPIQSAPESTEPRRSSFLQPQFIDESENVSSVSQIEETAIISTTRALETPRDTPNITTTLSEELLPKNSKFERQDFIWQPVNISDFHSSNVVLDLEHRKRHASPEIMDSQSP